MDELLSPPPTIKYYLGIAGYDEECDMLLSDLDGNILKSLSIGIVNPTVIGLNKMIQKLTDAIFRIAGDMQLCEISVSVGIEGIFRLGRGELKTALSGFGFACVRVLSNSRAAIMASLGEERAIFASLGYGSIVFAQKDYPHVTRIGGYGYLIGEPFSAFSLGKQAISAVLLAQDGIGEATELEKHLRAEVQVFEGALSPVLFSDRLLISRMAKAIFAASLKGDKIAEDIIRKNADELAAMINAAARHIGDDKVKLILSGSIMQYEESVLQALREALRKYPFSFEISVSNTPAVRGALRLAGLG